MNSNETVTVTVKETKMLRTIITIGLALCLAAIVAGYIYYGMQMAKAPAVIDSSDTVTTELSPSAAEILTALEAATPDPSTDTSAIVEALENEVPANSENRTEVLRALGYPETAQ
jgi:hypothetical protein